MTDYALLEAQENHNALVASLVNQIKELTARVEELETKEEQRARADHDREQALDAKEQNDLDRYLDYLEDGGNPLDYETGGC